MFDFFNDIDEKASDGAPHIMPIFAEIKTNSDINSVELEELDDVPVLALRNLVMFPGMTMPVSVGREKSLAAIRTAQKKHIPIAAFCQKSSGIDDPQFDDLHTDGTVADVIKILELPDKTINVILQGRKSVKLQALTATEPFLRGKVAPIVETLPKKSDTEFKALVRSIRDLTFSMLSKLGDGARDLSYAIKNIEDDVYLINFLATNIPFEPEEKQKLLQNHDIKKRAFVLSSILSQEAQFVDLRASIQSKTQQDLSQQQREHFLQQQIRTIQEELGNGEDDIDELSKRADEKDWSEAAANQFKKELKKLERLNPQSPDYSVQYQYLDTFLSLPWNKVTKDNFNLKRVEARLNKDHYGLEKVKDRILEHLAVLKLRGDLKAPIICLYGPPGVGKTSLGKSIAEALNRKYARISLGGLHDEAEIRGHRRTYIGAMPGRIIEALTKCESNNPVVVLDEIDKVGQDFKGDPSSALLEVLDPEQNSHFHDNYLDFDYDLSKILFIATANNLNSISQPLLDRMEIIEINGYIQEEKVEIAKRHLVPKQLLENGFEPKEISFPKATLEAIVSDYTRESGVRELEKKIGKVLRKVARKKASGDDYPRTISVDSLRELIGAKEYFKDSYEGNEFAGVVTGLAWTSVGGEILFVESSLSKAGKSGEKLTLTGNLGDVMKESAIIALQYIKAHSALFGINYELFDKYNVHIHVPEGAIPKDGPSAGITMVTSLVSSFTQRKVRDHMAMTGEITLRGKVLPVGGIKEKILAAKRAGITDIVLCKDNKKDIEESNDIYLKGLTFHYVDTIKDVIDYALLPDKVQDATPLDA